MLLYGVAFSELMGMIQYTRPFLGLVSKAKAAKLVRTLVDLYLDMEAATGEEVSLKVLFKFYDLIFIFAEPHYCRHFQSRVRNVLMCL